MKEVLLAKYGELALKGLNKSTFEGAMLKTIKKRMTCAGDFDVSYAQSTVYIEPKDESCDMDRAEDMLSRVFGISALCRAAVAPKNFEDIARTALEYLAPQLSAAASFRVDAKRSDKTFPLNSMELSGELGARILEVYPELPVKMNGAALTVWVEVRERAAYIHTGNIGAAGGMPTGTSGRAAIMLSGGIDSPVAAYMMAKRGLDLVAVHFQSPPYTGERALQKVMDLGGLLSRWCGTLPMFAVPFTDIQLLLRDKCPEDYFTLLMRRSMARVTDMIAAKEGCTAMITGESLAQVASQTLPAITCTDAAAKLPILRPLIGMDKIEIVAIARKIGTFETSSLPYEDCCTVFTPKHPRTHPRLAEVERVEALATGLDELERAAAENAELCVKHFYDEF